MAISTNPILKQAFLTPKAITASKTLLGTDSGTAWTNTNATGAITVTLPKAAVGLTQVTSGLQFTFLAAVNQSIIITPKTGDTIRALGLAAGAAFSIGQIGQIVTLTCLVAGFWEVSLDVLQGPLVIGPPASGTAFTVNVKDNTRGVSFNDQNAVQGFFLGFLNSNVERGFIGTGPGTTPGTALADFNIGADTGNLNLISGSTVCFQVTGTTDALKGLGPIAGALVDMTPDSGSFTLTHTGFTAGVTSTAHWYRIGNIVILNTGTASGTSNATTWTATGTPAGLIPNLTQTICIGDVSDNTAGAAATVSYSSGSGTLTFGKGFGAGGGFTAAGTKGFLNTGGTTFSYLLN